MRNQTCVLCIGKAGSLPLDHQRSPTTFESQADTLVIAVSVLYPGNFGEWIRYLTSCESQGIHLIPMGLTQLILKMGTCEVALGM